MKTLTILFILTSHALLGDTGLKTGLWLEEFTEPYYMLSDAGYDVQIVSIDGGIVPIDPGSVNFEGENPESVMRFLADEHAMKKLQFSSSIRMVSDRDYDAVILPGGHGTVYDYPDNKDLISLLNRTYANDNIIAAICHGPAGLVNVTKPNGEPLVKGKNITAFSDVEEQNLNLVEAVPFLLESRLRDLGANIETAPAFQEKALRDGNLITGQNPASSAAVGRLVLEALKEKQTD